MGTGRHRRDRTLLTAPIFNGALGRACKGLREARRRHDAHRPSRIPMSPLPFILAPVSLRRIDQKTGIAEDVHADDHVVSHVLPIGDGDRDLEFPAGDHDPGIDDVSFFRFVRRGRPNADAVEHGPETRTRRQIRVEAGPSRARVNPRQHADIALAAAEGDLFDDADGRPFLSLPPLGDHGVHRQLPSSRSIAIPQYSLNRAILRLDTFFSREPHRFLPRVQEPSMKIGVISKKPSYWSTKAILKSIREHGHEPDFVKTDEVRLVVAGTDDAVFNSKSLRSYDVLIPRIGRSMTDFGKMLLRQLELMGIRTTLASDGLITARNKFLALQSLRQAHIPIPRSILLASRPNFMEAAHLVRYPAILKILSGTQGIGVMRVKSLEETASIVDTLKFFGEVVCLQEYIPNPGVDIRALVVGDRVVGSMKRVAAHNEWRANIHLGAKGVAIELSDHAKDVAVRASKAVGLEISGVDMIFRGDTPYVLEVNASPGFRGLLDATGVNAADAIVEYAVEKVKAGEPKRP